MCNQSRKLQITLCSAPNSHAPIIWSSRGHWSNRQTDRVLMLRFRPDIESNIRPNTNNDCLEKPKLDLILCLFDPSVFVKYVYYLNVNCSKTMFRMFLSRPSPVISKHITCKEETSYYINILYVIE